jgi:hypothetical protein
MPTPEALHRVSVDPIAGTGFNYQDEIAVVFLLDVLEDVGV